MKELRTDWIRDADSLADQGIGFLAKPTRIKQQTEGCM